MLLLLLPQGAGDVAGDAVPVLAELDEVVEALVVRWGCRHR